MTETLYCDRCSVARATEVFTLKSGILAFCGHHSDQHRDALVTSGAIVEVLAEESATVLV